MKQSGLLLVLVLLVLLLALFSGCESRENPEELVTAPVAESSEVESLPEELPPIVEEPVSVVEEVHTAPYINEKEPPMLVNGENYIPDDFSVELKEVRGYNFEITTAEALEKLFAAADADGISLWVVSGYRSTEKQIANFNAKKAEWMAAGYSEDEAEKNTAEYIAYPGTSEHSIGRAVDLNSLEQTFENTVEFEWLYGNCAQFGFVLRYPKDKEATTKIKYEPWHYRYVGVEHATYIMENQLCLEEYTDYLHGLDS